MYSRNAKQLQEALRVEFPNLNYVLNEGKQRRGSFEITLQLDDGQLIQVWSGIEKTPRKAKFPEHSEIIKELNKLIN